MREKDLPAPKTRWRSRVQIVRLAAPFGARVLLHGDPRLARETGCAGVHLPAGGDVAAARAVLGPGAWVSVSAHSFEEVAGGGRAPALTR